MPATGRPGGLFEIFRHSAAAAARTRQIRAYNIIFPPPPPLLGLSDTPLRSAVAQNCRPHRPQNLHVFSHHAGEWLPRHQDEGDPLAATGDEVLTTVSWNLWYSAPDPRARATAALDHIQAVLAGAAGAAERTVIMLQEVEPGSLDAILQHRWIRSGFAVSDVGVPEAGYTTRSRGQFGWAWRPARYFNVMAVPSHLAAVGCFRVPLDPTPSGRDGLFVDVPLRGGEDGGGRQRCVRLGATHLEPMIVPGEIRAGQLELLARWLKGREPSTAEAEGPRVVAGILAGDMNALQGTDDEYVGRPEVALRDVWQEKPPAEEPIPRRPGMRDLTAGRVRGNTWGYQCKPPTSSRKRLDKVLVWAGDGGGERTAIISALPPAQLLAVAGGGEPGGGGSGSDGGGGGSSSGSSSTDVSGCLRRIGIGLKTRVDGWEISRWRTVRGGEAGRERDGKRLRKTIVSAAELDKLRERNVRMERAEPVSGIEWWVSDHFGVVARFRVRGDHLPPKEAAVEI